MYADYSAMRHGLHSVGRSDHSGATDLSMSPILQGAPAGLGSTDASSTAAMDDAGARFYGSSRRRARELGLVCLPVAPTTDTTPRAPATSSSLRRSTTGARRHNTPPRADRCDASPSIAKEFCVQCSVWAESRRHHLETGHWPAKQRVAQPVRASRQGAVASPAMWPRRLRDPHFDVPASHIRSNSHRSGAASHSSGTAGTAAAAGDDPAWAAATAPLTSHDFERMLHLAAAPDADPHTHRNIYAASPSRVREQLDIHESSALRHNTDASEPVAPHWVSLGTHDFHEPEIEVVPLSPTGGDDDDAADAGTGNAAQSRAAGTSNWEASNPLDPAVRIASEVLLRPPATHEQQQEQRCRHGSSASPVKALTLREAEAQRRQSRSPQRQAEVAFRQQELHEQLLALHERRHAVRARCGDEGNVADLEGAAPPPVLEHRSLTGGGCARGPDERDEAKQRGWHHGHRPAPSPSPVAPSPSLCDMVDTSRHRLFDSPGAAERAAAAEVAALLHGVKSAARASAHRYPKSESRHTESAASPLPPPLPPTTLPLTALPQRRCEKQESAAREEHVADDAAEGSTREVGRRIHELEARRAAAMLRTFSPTRGNIPSRSPPGAGTGAGRLLRGGDESFSDVASDDITIAVYEDGNERIAAESRARAEVDALVASLRRPVHELRGGSPQKTERRKNHLASADHAPREMHGECQNLHRNITTPPFNDKAEVSGAAGPPIVAVPAQPVDHSHDREARTSRVISSWTDPALSEDRNSAEAEDEEAERGSSDGTEHTRCSALGESRAEANSISELPLPRGDLHDRLASADYFCDGEGGDVVDQPASSGAGDICGSTRTTSSAPLFMIDLAPPRRGTSATPRRSQENNEDEREEKSPAARGATARGIALRAGGSPSPPQPHAPSPPSAMTATADNDDDDIQQQGEGEKEEEEELVMQQERESRRVADDLRKEESEARSLDSHLVDDAPAPDGHDVRAHAARPLEPRMQRAVDELLRLRLQEEEDLERPADLFEPLPQHVPPATAATPPSQPLLHPPPPSAPEGRPPNDLPPPPAHCPAASLVAVGVEGRRLCDDLHGEGRAEEETVRRDVAEEEAAPQREMLLESPRVSALDELLPVTTTAESGGDDGAKAASRRSDVGGSAGSSNLIPVVAARAETKRVCDGDEVMADATPRGNQTDEEPPATAPAADVAGNGDELLPSPIAVRAADLHTRPASGNGVSMTHQQGREGEVAEPRPTEGPLQRRPPSGDEVGDGVIVDVSDDSDDFHDEVTAALSAVVGGGSNATAQQTTANASSDAHQSPSSSPARPRSASMTPAVPPDVSLLIPDPQCTPRIAYPAPRGEEHGQKRVVGEMAEGGHEDPLLALTSYLSTCEALLQYGRSTPLERALATDADAARMEAAAAFAVAFDEQALGVLAKLAGDFPAAHARFLKAGATLISNNGSGSCDSTCASLVATMERELAVMAAGLRSQQSVLDARVRSREGLLSGSAQRDAAHHGALAEIDDRINALDERYRSLLSQVQFTEVCYALLAQLESMLPDAVLVREDVMPLFGEFIVGFMKNSMREEDSNFTRLPPLRHRRSSEHLSIQDLRELDGEVARACRDATLAEIRHGIVLDEKASGPARRLLQVVRESCKRRDQLLAAEQGDTKTIQDAKHDAFTELVEVAGEYNAAVREVLAAEMQRRSLDEVHCAYRADLHKQNARFAGVFDEENAILRRRLKENEKFYHRQNDVLRLLKTELHHITELGAVQQLLITPAFVEHPIGPASRRHQSYDLLAEVALVNAQLIRVLLLALTSRRAGTIGGGGVVAVSGSGSDADCQQGPVRDRGASTAAALGAEDNDKRDDMEDPLSPPQIVRGCLQRMHGAQAALAASFRHFDERHRQRPARDASSDSHPCRSVKFDTDLLRSAAGTSLSGRLVQGTSGGAPLRLRVDARDDGDSSTGVAPSSTSFSAEMRLFGPSSAPVPLMEGHLFLSAVRMMMSVGVMVYLCEGRSDDADGVVRTRSTLRLSRDATTLTISRSRSSSNDVSSTAVNDVSSVPVEVALRDVDAMTTGPLERFNGVAAPSLRIVTATGRRVAWYFPSTASHEEWTGVLETLVRNMSRIAFLQSHLVRV